MQHDSHHHHHTINNRASSSSSSQSNLARKLVRGNSLPFTDRRSSLFLEDGEKKSMEEEIGKKKRGKQRRTRCTPATTDIFSNIFRKRIVRNLFSMHRKPFRFVSFAKATRKTKIHLNQSLLLEAIVRHSKSMSHEKSSRPDRSQR